jgi:hypothetical protein
MGERVWDEKRSDIPMAMGLVRGIDPDGIDRPITGGKRPKQLYRFYGWCDVVRHDQRHFPRLQPSERQLDVQLFGVEQYKHDFPFGLQY